VTTAPADDRTVGRKRKGSGLDAMVLPELKQLASTLGLRGTAAMRKGQLIEAIQSAQSGGRPSAGQDNPRQGNRGQDNRGTRTGDAEAQPTLVGSERAVDGVDSRRDFVSDQTRGEHQPEARADRGSEAHADRQPEARADGGSERAAERVDDAGSGERPSTSDRTEAREDRPDRSRQQEESDGEQSRNRRDDSDRDTGERDGGFNERRNRRQRDGGNRSDNRDGGTRTDNRGGDNRDGGTRDGGNRNENRDAGTRDGGNRNDSRQGNRNEARDANRENQGRNNDADRGDNRDNQGRTDRGNDRNNDYDDDGGNRRGRRRRNRDRQNRRGGRGTGGVGLDRYESDPVVSEDDVLVPVAGILDLMDNYAFVRTSGYLPGSEDAYVAMSMAKKLGLRKGDVVTGAIRQSREGDRKEKFNPVVRIDTINGADPEKARTRPEFGKLTPLYPQERMRLETTPNVMTTRLIDIVAPVGKGQRGLIVSPTRAGKTLVMQAIANAITTNNPEVHLMVVLVDERPEEVTDMQRAVKGEVIASTFDRPASDHTMVAELAIERAKRLVELGHDVVVLLDSITRLGRAYNIAAPASGRILSGGVDSAALYPPKKFFGAARNIEHGGSLTILATALIETGSKMDEVIFEEFKGTGNMELRLRREYADRRIFPAIDVNASGTRREELLMGKEELQIIWKLRRVLAGLEGQQGLEMLLDRLRKTQNNGEFMQAITKTMPARGDED
jgi:transcription termination factor Rho